MNLFEELIESHGDTPESLEEEHPTYSQWKGEVPRPNDMNDFILSLKDFAVQTANADGASGEAADPQLQELQDQIEV
ncbi:hypothetical protein [Candidatus Poriferisodalis sp.]|uniref:hypothetical protein n=1 Tax=Candidatus Poriferisodalis sp. TaxID=3101277 RepID=UPI003B592C7A